MRKSGIESVVSVLLVLLLVTIAALACGGGATLDGGASLLAGAVGDDMQSSPSDQLLRLISDKDGDGPDGCESCHLTPPEDADMSWMDAPGRHANCGECHEGEHGESPDPPDSVCMDCHQQRWEKKHGAEETDCLSCHFWPHVPLEIELVDGIHEDHPTPEIDCSACHRVMGGIMPDRARCLVCHADDDEHSRGALCRICHKS